MTNSLLHRISAHLRAVVLIRVRYLAAILLFNFVSTSGQETSDLQNSLTALDSFDANNHSGEEFAAAINGIQNAMVNAEEFNLIPKLSMHVDQLNNFKFSQTGNKRKAYVRHAAGYDFHLSEYISALKYYLLAHSTLGEMDASFDDWSWYCENPLGNIYTRLGDHEKAFYYYRIASDALRSQNRENNASNLSRLYSNMANAAFWKEDLDLSIEYYTRGLKLSKESQSDDGIFKNTSGIIEPLLKAGDIELAESYLKQMENVVITDSSLYWDTHYIFNKAIGNFQLCINSINKKVSQFIAEGVPTKSREFGKLHNDKAQIYLEQGLLRQSRSSIREGLGSLFDLGESIFITQDSLYEENTISELYTTLGDYFYKKYLVEKNKALIDSAEMSYELAIKCYDLLESQLLMEDSKLITIGARRDVINRLFECHGLRAENDIAIDIKSLLQLFRKSKGQLLNSEQSRNVLLDRLSDSDRELFTSNQQEIARLKIDRDNFDKRLIQLSEENKAIWDKAFHIDSVFISDHFIDFAVASENIYSLSNFQGILKFHNHGKKSHLFEMLGNARTELLGLVPEKKLRSTMGGLFHTLLEPLMPLPEKFSIISEGALDRIPIDIMVNQNGDYLIQHHEVTYRFSQNIYVQKELDQKATICIYPDYGKPNNDSIYNRSEVYPLKFAELEAKNFSEIYPDAKVMRNVSQREFLDLLRNSTLLHYSGHAKVDQFKGKIILGKVDSIDRKSLSGIEIAASTNNLETVILSACETSLGDLKRGEGAMSLARAFMESGTKNIVSSLWTVNDFTTSTLMGHFHENFNSKLGVSESLRAAKLKYLKDSKGESRHPYYWSGFINYSSITPHLEMGKCSNKIIIATAAVISILIFISIKKLL